MLAPLAAAALAAAPQVTVVHDVVPTPPGRSSEPFGLLAARSGGVFVAESERAAPLGDVTRQLIHRIGPHGAVLWTAGVAPSSGTSLPYVSSMVEDASGSVYVAFDENLPAFASVARVVKVTADGTVAWDADLRRPGAPPALYRAVGIGLSASGDVLVGGGTAGAVRDVWLRALDPATGQELWEFRRTGCEKPSMVAALGGAYLGYMDFTTSTPVLDLVDAGGALVRRLDPPVAGPAPYDAVIVGAALSDGSALFTQRLPDSAPGPSRLARVGPSGAVLWSREDLFLPAFGPEGVGAGDELALTSQGSTDPATRSPLRIDRDGATLWSVPAPAGVDFYRKAVDLGGGATGALCEVDLNGSNLWRGSLQLIDAAGIDGGVASLVPGARAAAQSRDLALGATGQLWTTLVDTSDPLRTVTRVSRAVLGEPLGTRTCDAPAPNSVGRTGAIQVVGSPEAAANNITLAAVDLPPGVPVLFCNGTATAFLPGAGGSSGALCLGGAIGRYNGPGQVLVSNDLGVAALRLDLPATPRPLGTSAPMAGQVLYFQAWHLDLINGTFPTSNFTNARGLRFH